ncbi:conserved hypothetical protein [Ricinus communis]|uniref:Uncharacterized protein n=1 Tax=Ricinus communis TaxID=3988 RepID=B9TE28_RICCO|nr:conserved hypothetical protein [Ricinus communis]
MSKTETQSEALRLAAKLRGEAENSIVKYSTAHLAAKELERLDAENKALRADAERYRWLRDFHNGPDGVFSGLPYISAGDGNDSAWALTGVTADAGIDAAMEAAKSGGAA